MSLSSRHHEHREIDVSAYVHERELLEVKADKIGGIDGHELRKIGYQLDQIVGIAPELDERGRRVVQ